MSECPHGQERGIHCPPCDGHAGRRLPDWQLVRRIQARYDGRCHGCRDRLSPGDRISLWTDAHRADGGLATCCWYCHPDRGPETLPALETHGPSGDLACPLCGTRLTVDRRRTLAGRHMTAAADSKPAACRSCGYQHTVDREANRG